MRPYGSISLSMKTDKNVYSITELVRIGYPEELIRRLLKSEDFPEIGFRARGKNSKAYFWKDKLDRHLSYMTEVNQL